MASFCKRIGMESEQNIDQSQYLLSAKQNPALINKTRAAGFYLAAKNGQKIRSITQKNNWRLVWK